MSRNRIAHQYPFRKRLDRQWVALRLAAGVAPESIAQIERAELGAVQDLLADRSFQRVVGAWREHLEVGEEERLARLTRLALDVLELAIVNGDRRAAAFFLAERTAGRHPGRSLAKAVEASLARAGNPAWRRPVGQGVAPVAPEAPVPTEPEPEAVACAAGDPEVEAEALTAHTLRSLTQTRLGLRRRLMAEHQRAATTTARPTDVLAEHGLRDAASWVEAVAHDPEIELPPQRTGPSLAARARARVTLAVHRYAIERVGRLVREAAQADLLVDVVGAKPGRGVLAAWLRLG